MIFIVTGKPGAGKTYLLLHLLTTLYYHFNDKLQKWIINLHPDEDNQKPYTIISNIEGLLLPHIDLDNYIKKCGVPVLKFFTEPYQKQIAEKYPNVIYIIDECQRYFDQKMNDTDCLYFFEHHRHLGIDIYLMAQTYERINRNIRGLEYKRYHAITRMMSLFGEFSYSIISDKEKVDTKIVRKNKKLFELYKSRERKEITKSKNPFIKYFIISIIVALLSLYFFKTTFLDSGKKKLEEKKKDIKTVQTLNKNQKQNNTKNKKEHEIPNDDIKYYYNLSTVSVYNTETHKTKVMYVDQKLNIMLPISIIKYPIIQRSPGRYLVVCNYPNEHFQKKEIETTQETQDSQIDDVME